MTQASVGFHCPDCVRQGRQKVVRGNAAFGRNPSSTPITFILIAVNVIVFLFEIAKGDVLVRTGSGFSRVNQVLADYGLNGPAVAQGGEWWRLVTSAFLHVNILHLALNMYALFILGPIVERSLGPRRFAIIYATSLMAGAAGALLLSPNELTAGASGAIYGLLGALVIVFRNRGISLWQSGLGITIVLNLAFTLAIPNISLGGHLGGFVGGLLAGLVLVEGPQKIRNRQTVVWVALALVPIFFAVGLAAASSA
jgi:membrane associated rhomboid family serine protease